MPTRKVSASDWALSYSTWKHHRPTEHNYPANRKSRKTPSGEIKPAAFNVSPRLEIGWFASEHDYWCACYATNLVWWRGVCFHRNLDRYVNLKHDYLENVVIKPILLERQALLCDNTAVRGRKAFGFKLGEQFRATERRVCLDDKLNRRIASVYAEEDRRQPFHRELEKWQTQVSVEWSQAEAILSSLKPKRRSTHTPEEYQDILRQPLRLLSNGEGWLLVNKVGRVSTTINCLKRELRAALRLNGKPLATVDVSCCQLLILGGVVRDWYAGNRKTRKRLREVSFEGKQSPYANTERSLQARARHQAQGTPITTFNITQPIDSKGVTKTPTRYALPADVVEFIALCEQGRIYQMLQLEGEPLARTKIRVLAAVYAGNHTLNPRLRQTQRQLRVRFPSVMKVVREMKRRQHSRLACLMQNIESTLMINRVCRRLLTDHPTIPVLPIHDAIATHPEHLDRVESIIKEEFAGIGLHLTIKRKET
jgi:hypothetical protein